MDEQFDITVIIATYNRAEMLADALESVLAQDAGGLSFELIVVDNNSPDNTRQVVESYIARGHKNLRYLFEGQQGVAHARNKALAHARAPIIAFTDDDVRVAPDWVRTIKRALDEHPEVDCVGGKVLPLWRKEPPTWLTNKHWSPLALVDYGEKIIYTNTDWPLCLVTANLAFRREVFDRIGLFEHTCQRVKDGIGSTEDHELQIRFWNTGSQGLYDPRLVVHADVQPERMTKAYHRRWHTGHGRFSSLMRLKDYEAARARLFGVSSNLYKQAFLDSLSWLKFMLTGNSRMAFRTEIKLRFFLGFYRQRRSEYQSTNPHGLAHELTTFVRSLLASGKNSHRISKEAG
ncbi:MAG TPA: glycosyltransferase [Pyrinomonadaceae bacterium]|jgi:glycosyltransferase involved in cell wall biosynthesis